jgi:hypothetical protein
MVNIVIALDIVITIVNYDHKTFIAQVTGANHLKRGPLQFFFTNVINTKLHHSFVIFLPRC